MDLRALVEMHTQDPNWGQYAQRLLSGEYEQPRDGGDTDNAHPPIHPTKWVAPSSLSGNERKIYEYVCRHFLACCGRDAQGWTLSEEVLTHEHTLVQARSPPPALLFTAACLPKPFVSLTQATGANKTSRHRATDIRA